MIKRLVRRLYHAMPFKRHAYTALKQVWIPSFYRRLHFEGPFRVAVPGTPGFLMQHYNRHGLETEFFWKPISEAWEAASLAVWIKLLQTSEVVLDVGAGEGIYALVSKCMRPTARVLAFEPLPAAVDVLRRNVALNGYDIPCMPVALADFEGTARFYAENPLTNEGSLLGNTGRAAVCEVPVRTLRSVAEEYALTGIDLIKIDVEGAESAVLVGMGDLLARFRPSLLVEVLTDKAGADIEQIVASAVPDYQFFDVNDDIRIGPRILRKRTHITKSTCLNYLLLPPERVQQAGLS